MKKKNILVTGGAGFIGGHLCKLLVKKKNIIATGKIIPPPLTVISLCELLTFGLSTTLYLIANFKYKNEIITKSVKTSMYCCMA